MTTKIVIIIPNENKISLSEPYVEECEQFHKEQINKFCYEIGITLTEHQQENSHLGSKELAIEGFCTILCDETPILTNMIIFLPNEIGDNQYNWFNKRIEGLKRYNISIFNYTNSQEWELLDHATIKEPMIESLKKLLEEKHVSKGKIKQRTKN